MEHISKLIENLPRYIDGKNEVESDQIRCVGYVLMGWAMKSPDPKQLLGDCDLEAFPPKIRDALSHLKQGNPSTINQHLIDLGVPLGSGEGFERSVATYTNDKRDKAVVEFVRKALSRKISSILTEDELAMLLAEALARLPNGRKSLHEAVQRAEGGMQGLPKDAEGNSGMEGS